MVPQEKCYAAILEHRRDDDVRYNDGEDVLEKKKNVTSEVH